jgi:hypothetical protein
VISAASQLIEAHDFTNYIGEYFGDAWDQEGEKKCAKENGKKKATRPRLTSELAIPRSNRAFPPRRALISAVTPCDGGRRSEKVKIY